MFAYILLIKEMICFAQWGEGKQGSTVRDRVSLWYVKTK